MLDDHVCRLGERRTHISSRRNQKVAQLPNRLVRQRCTWDRFRQPFSANDQTKSVGVSDSQAHYATKYAKLSVKSCTTIKSGNSFFGLSFLEFFLRPVFSGTTIRRQSWSAQENAQSKSHWEHECAVLAITARWSLRVWLGRQPSGRSWRTSLVRRSQRWGETQSTP